MPRRHILRREPAVWMVRVAGYFALTVAVRLGLGALIPALFKAWNLTPETVARAPGWARTLYTWQGSVVTFIVDCAAVMFACLACRARLSRPDLKRGLFWWIAGTGIALLSAALFLLTDSLRLYWPLSAPRLSAALLPLWGLTLLTALAEELFTKGVLYDAVARGRGAIWGVAASALAFFLMNGGYSGTWISGINVALMGVLCALLYRLYGLWAPVAFRWGWAFATVFLLGQGGGALAVYRLYGVSENWLTGGDAGLIYGLWVTIVMIVLTGINMRRPR